MLSEQRAPKRESGMLYQDVPDSLVPTLNLPFLSCTLALDRRFSKQPFRQTFLRKYESNLGGQTVFFFCIFVFDVFR